MAATALMAAVGNASAFDNGRQLAAWLGLVPKQHSTVLDSSFWASVNVAIPTCVSFLSTAPELSCELPLTNKMPEVAGSRACSNAVAKIAPLSPMPTKWRVWPGS